jgi:hypothetical protein
MSRPEVVHRGGGAVYEWSSDTVRVLSAADWSGRAVTVVEDTLKEGSAVFGFDDSTVTARAGSVITVPPMVHHEVACVDGARLLTVFAPGGFDLYLGEVAELVAQGIEDPQRLAELGQAYDIWPDA